MPADLSLKNYIRISDGNASSFGGSQTWFSLTKGSRDRLLHRGGCGLVAVGDLLLYLCREKDLKDGSLPAGPFVVRDRSDYLAYLRRISRFRYPVFPYAGSFNLQIPLFVNAFLRKNHRPERLHFVFPNTAKKRNAMIEKSLRAGYPVILIMSAHLFRPFSKKGVSFYRLNEDDSLNLSHRDVYKHFVTITGIRYSESNGAAPLYEISSWGGRYYIDSRELTRYINKESCPLTSGIFCLR